MAFAELGVPKNEPRRKAAPPREASVAEALGLLIGAFFAAPALMGYGEHWYLSPKERTMIGDQGEAAIASLPDSDAAKVTRLIKKYAPVTGFLTSVGVAGYTRWQLTRQLMEEQRARTHETSGGAPAGAHRAPPVRGGVSRPGAETEGPRPPRSTLTELFERDEG